MCFCVAVSMVCVFLMLLILESMKSFHVPTGECALFSFHCSMRSCCVSVCCRRSVILADEMGIGVCVCLFLFWFMSCVSVVLLLLMHMFGSWGGVWPAWVVLYEVSCVWECWCSFSLFFSSLLLWLSLFLAEFRWLGVDMPRARRSVVVSSAHQHSSKVPLQRCCAGGWSFGEEFLVAALAGGACGWSRL